MGGVVDIVSGGGFMALGRAWHGVIRSDGVSPAVMLAKSLVGMP